MSRLEPAVAAVCARLDGIAREIAALSGERAGQAGDPPRGLPGGDL
ncbi:hypothetical protein [Actinomadura sp. HBU206391]|nr:hypothetical protein [Actinomadura sp. HBU206391]MBC6458756.1 hypothetical protein [Actinomadura sp. HBU206391]